MADDYAASTASRGRLTVGNSIKGTIEQSGDRDWFAVTLTAGWRYRVTLQGLDSRQGTLDDPALRILDASDHELDYDNDLGLGLESLLLFTPPLTATYYLSAEGEGDWTTGSYRLTVKQDGSDDYPASTLTQAVAIVGGSRTGIVEVASDQDWCSVMLTAGDRYQIDLVGWAVGTAAALADPVLRLYDDHGAILRSNDDVGTSFNAALTYTAERSGVYYLSAEGFNDEIGGWRLTVTSLLPPVPTRLDLAAMDDSGLSNSDHITLQTSGLTISGYDGKQGSVMILFSDRDNDGVVDDGELVATTVVSATEWHVDVDLTSGTHRIRALQSDQGGHSSRVSTALLITVDTTVPARLTGLDLAAADDKGSSSSDNITAQTAALSFSSASAENGARVILFEDRNSNAAIDSGESIGTTTVANSRWSIDGTLTWGQHAVRALQQDRAGHTSPVSEPLTVMVVESGRNNSRTTATKVKPLSAVAVVMDDWVGVDDSSDYYQLQWAAGSTLTATLAGLMANADMQLLNDKGTRLTQSNRNDMETETIRYRNNTTGTMLGYLQIYPAASGINTSYQLSLSL
ncbi:MAG: pre-peptidase C-terminal domain-containing protein [Magnetococcales bacterium]|nr:pre-peptidase C-terminal domain-containing protein [Magnetococcales bacterium]